jgi:hypothetical protein
MRPFQVSCLDTLQITGFEIGGGLGIVGVFQRDLGRLKERKGPGPRRQRSRSLQDQRKTTRTRPEHEWHPWRGHANLHWSSGQA